MFDSPMLRSSMHVLGMTVAALALSLVLLTIRLNRVEGLIRARVKHVRRLKVHFMPSKEMNGDEGDHLAEGACGLASCASDRGPKTLQEDHCGFQMLPGCNVVAVADGVSGSPNAYLASPMAITAVLAHFIEGVNSGQDLGLHSMKESFKNAKHAVELLGPLENDIESTAATTLIVAVELPDRFLIGYTGDGAVVLLRGNLQWQTNLLFPQTGWGGGITHLLRAGEGSWEPAVFQIPKSWPDGGIMLIGTDGALVAGRTLETARSIVSELRTAALETHDLTPGMIQRTLECWVRDRSSSDDNRSLGLLLSAQALHFWQDEMKMRVAKDGSRAEW